MIPVLQIILGKVSDQINKLRRMKEKHTWAFQIVKRLLLESFLYEYEDNGRNPEYRQFYLDQLMRTADIRNILMYWDYDEDFDTTELTWGGGQRHSGRRKKETPILVAAKNGVMEIVEKILELFPQAIDDVNEDEKNIVLLAVEHRQPHVYEFLLKQRYRNKEITFHQVDKEGNSALHMAAKFGAYKPRLIGVALQMQWELKWYQFVEESMPLNFSCRYNKMNETPSDIFITTHKDQVKSGNEWLNRTLESGSVVATLVAAVSFATAATVPGGVNQNSGQPILEKEPAFIVFAISSLLALFCSVTAVVMFLSIQLASSFLEENLNKNLPKKLVVGLTSLFMSVTAMLVSFCAGHFFVLKDQLQDAALPLYVVTSIPVILFVSIHFPLYFDLLWVIFKPIPQRGYKPTQLNYMSGLQ